MSDGLHPRFRDLFAVQALGFRAYGERGRGTGGGESFLDLRMHGVLFRSLLHSSARSSFLIAA